VIRNDLIDDLRESANETYDELCQATIDVLHRAADAIQGVLAIHVPSTRATSGSTDPNWKPTYVTICALCVEGWPCATVRLVGGPNYGEASSDRGTP